MCKLQREKGTWFAVVGGWGSYRKTLLSERRSLHHRQQDHKTHFFYDARHFPIFAEEAVRLNPQKNEIGVDYGARRDHLKLNQRKSKVL